MRRKKERKSKRDEWSEGEMRNHRERERQASLSFPLWNCNLGTSRTSGLVLIPRGLHVKSADIICSLILGNALCFNKHHVLREGCLPPTSTTADPVVSVQCMISFPIFWVLRKDTNWPLRWSQSSIFTHVEKCPFQSNRSWGRDEIKAMKLVVSRSWENASGRERNEDYFHTRVALH